MTPMLRQYFEIKANHKDKILFFRLGDFYEMFGQDAVMASQILDIALTARYRGTENEIPMCGIPHHAMEQYVAKLTKAGKKVGICEQVSDPALPGIVKREVVQILTPGTTLDNTLLDKSENNFLASVVMGKQMGGRLNYGLACADLSTGEFKVTEVSGGENLMSELKRINPVEIIVDKKNDNSLFAGLPSAKNFEDDKLFRTFKNVSKYSAVNYEEPAQILREQFEVKTLEGFGVAHLKLGIEAAANLVMYLKETQKTQITHLNKISYHNPFAFMILDEATIRNLDLIYNTQTKGKEGSLLFVLDKTATAMGARMLRQWILHPLIDPDNIKKRLDAVEYFFVELQLREKLRNLFKRVMDIERLLARIGCRRANARDLAGLKESLKVSLEVKSEIRSSGFESPNFINSERENDLVNEVIKLIEDNIIDDAPISIVDGGIIKDGVNQELDDLRKISTGGKDWIADMQTRERQRTGINSLKIKFNRVFGYYIEVSNANIKSVPEDYTRKQTLVNGERFMTPELKEYEEKVLTAEEKIKDIEYKLFNDILSKVAEYSAEIQKVARGVAELDVVTAFAQIARENNYTRPIYYEAGNTPGKNHEVINIKEGRHPVIEKMPGVEFIPNDSYFDNKAQLMLLTGPNMAGKSVYLRQNALIILMAQIGCFVPAARCELSIADRIFTRVGASDNIAYGQSTFMVEMQEAANILNNATEKSFIVFDELGRGTSTYDGVSIAWAVIEYLHDKVGAKTLFATHYHELVDLAQKMERVQNFRMAVLENEDGVVFLHKIIKGGIDRSYGIEVARLAGLPKDLISRAQEILHKLEADKIKVTGMEKQLELLPHVKPEAIKIESAVEKEISKADLNNMTPMEAMNFLQELKNKIMGKY